MHNNQDPLKVALCGYGYAGKTFHAPLIANTDGLELSCVVSSDAAKVHQDFPGMCVASQADQAINDPDIDLIVIASPNTTHFPLASQALAAGKHVVVDKPFVFRAADARCLYELAAHKKRIVSVFQNRRWDSDFLCVQTLLSDGELGVLSHVQLNFDRFRPTVRKRWREEAIEGSGLWFDLGSHLADQAVVLFGEPDSVLADLSIQRESAEAVDYFHCLLTYGQMRVILHGSTIVAAQSPRFTIHGQKGSFIKYGLDLQENALKLGQVPGSGQWGQDFQPGTLYKPSAESDDVMLERTIPAPAGNYLAYYEAINQSIRHDAANPVSMEQAEAVARILELGVSSAASGRRLPFVAQATPSA